MGTDKNADGNSTTASFFELGLTGTLATSIYQAGLANGSQVIDTNRTSVINSKGFTTGTYSNIINTGNVAISDTPTIGQKNVDSLNPLSSAIDDTENFNVPNGWQLYFDYIFTGTFSTSTGPNFNGGDVAVYFDDLATAGLDNIQVLRVNVTGSQIAAANLDVFGTVSFDFDNNGTNDCTTAFCQNFWNFETGSQRWYDLDQDLVAITFHLDTNVNPPIPTPTQLTAGANPQNPFWARQTTLDSSIRFNVPEPGTLALLGIALSGLGFFGMRRKVG
jgi:hypothetical protein